MEYDEAKTMGDVGERRVSEILDAEAQGLGARVIHNILLDLGNATTQIDHIWIDRFGVLLVETKVRGNAVIKGKSSDARWTVCYAGGRRDHMQNPLVQNDRHREMLHRALHDFGQNLPPSYVQSLVVFCGTRLDTLGVDEIDSERVIREYALAQWLRDRENFHPNEGALSAEDVGNLRSILYSIDKTGDPVVEARHRERVTRASRRWGKPRAGSGSDAPRRPAGSRHFGHGGASRYPDGLQARRSSWWDKKWVGQVVRLAAMLLFLGWLGFGGGARVLMPSVQRLAEAFFTSAFVPTQAGQPATRLAAPAVPDAGAVDIQLAYRRLGEADAKTAAAVADRDRPELSFADGMTTYRWNTVVKTSAGSAKTSWIAITLDPNGQIIGVNAP